MRDPAEDFIARQLAAAVLATDWSAPALREAVRSVFGEAAPRRQAGLARALSDKFASDYKPSPRALAGHLREHSTLQALVQLQRKRQSRLPLVLASPRFTPVARFASLGVPPIATVGDLAQWLGLSFAHLDWYADQMRQHGRTDEPSLQHYTYTFIPKRSGPPRLLEAPKPRLMAIQRRILREILDKAPPHAAAHGFVKGRSCQTGAVVHTGETMVVTADLADFFPVTPLRRVHGVFRSLGYPWAAARALTGLCSTSTPASVFARLPVERLHPAATVRMYNAPHLPQGAPTSPALANLAAYRLDLRLTGLARSFGAAYTRYADDLSFSGDATFVRKADLFLKAVAVIANDEGYALNPCKTRLMRASGRQTVTGIVVNDHLNVPRDAYDQLKATLTNCIRNGPERENRDAHADFRGHLDGRIAWVESLNLRRGTRLRMLFERIAWPPA